MSALYLARVRDFLNVHTDRLIGILTTGLAREGFDTNPSTVFSWEREVSELKESLQELSGTLPPSLEWFILLEYVLPVVGQRVDCVLLAQDLIFVIEYKNGSSVSARAALQQAQEYALNLVDFHEESRNRTAVPIAVGHFKTCIPLNTSCSDHGAAVAPSDLPGIIVQSCGTWTGTGTTIQPQAWDAARYFPVPTIVAAATAVYGNHNVKDLAFSRAGADNLEATQTAIALAVREARSLGTKILLVITGVPGAGKTLAGLNAVQSLTRELDADAEQAAFLSGNGPLVKVLQEALKRSIGFRKKGAARSVQSRVREVHRFVQDTYKDHRAPGHRMIVFDEAQRAWTAAKNFKKFGRDVSEPEMVLDIMGRHQGWAVVVALVGGGQEIHAGEAGLAAWGDAIAKRSSWSIITSPEAVDGGPSVAGSRLFRADARDAVPIKLDTSLHLNVSKRSYATVVTAAWVNALLEGRTRDAKDLSLRGLPIYLTRDINLTRSWLRARTRGRRRAGLVASSGAARLRAEGVEAPTYDFLKGVDYVKWFLEFEGDHRSSNQLEVAMSEFEMQGLELDSVGLLWGGDLLFQDGEVVARRLRGRTWCSVGGIGDPQASADDPQTKILNKYRVLLTRFRKDMVIFVPTGCTEDATRAPRDFDSVYEYLLRCGVHALSDKPIAGRQATGTSA